MGESSPIVLRLRPGRPGHLVCLGPDGQGRPNYALHVGRPLGLVGRAVTAWAHILAPGQVEVVVDGREQPLAPPPRLEPIANGTRCILYHCFGGAHTSVVAGAIHLGMLPSRPTWRQVAGFPLFDRTTTRDRGWPLYLGTDEKGRRVYAMGRGRDSRAATRALTALTQALGMDGQLTTHDTLACAGSLTKLGGYLSRRLGLVRAGRALAALGITRDLPRLLRVVEQARGAPHEACARTSQSYRY